MNYVRVMTARKRAVAASRVARGELGAAVDTLNAAYAAHPVAMLAGAAGIGFVLARLRVGGGLIRTGMRIATGPAWQLVRQYWRI